MRLRTITALVCLLPLASVTADPSLIFDLDDYVDPLDRGYRYDSKEHQGLDFLFATASAGYLSEVEFADQYSSIETLFHSYALDYYRGRFQGGFLLTDFNDKSTATDSSYMELQGSYYFLSPSDKAEDKADADSRIRSHRASLFISRGHDLQGNKFTDFRFSQDVAVNTDGFWTNAFGGLEYRYRKQDRFDDYHSVSFRQEAQCYSGPRATIYCGFSLNANRRTKEFKFVSAELELLWEYNLDFADVYLGYSPTYNKDRELNSRKWIHQVALYISVPFARVIDRQR